MTEKLKLVRCGCGGEVILGAWFMVTKDHMVYAISCKRCGIQIKPFDSEAEAIEAWNRVMSHDTERTAKVLNRSEGFYSAHGVCICGHCEHCGNAVCDDFHICPECGAKLDWSE